MCTFSDYTVVVQHQYRPPNLEVPDDHRFVHIDFVCDCSSKADGFHCHSVICKCKLYFVVNLLLPKARHSKKSCICVVLQKLQNQCLFCVNLFLPVLNSYFSLQMGGILRIMLIWLYRDNNCHLRWLTDEAQLQDCETHSFMYLSQPQIVHFDALHECAGAHFFQNF